MTRSPISAASDVAPGPIDASRPIQTPGPDHRIGADKRAGADMGARSDDGAGIDDDAALRAAPADGRGHAGKRRSPRIPEPAAPPSEKAAIIVSAIAR